MQITNDYDGKAEKVRIVQGKNVINCLFLEYNFFLRRVFYTLISMQVYNYENMEVNQVC